MSIAGLIDNSQPGSKQWANLFVHNITATGSITGGGGIIQTGPIISQTDSTGAGATSQFIAEGLTTPAKQLNIGYDIVHEAGYIQAQHVGNGPTPLLLNQNASNILDFVGVQSGTIYSIPDGNNTAMAVFGSGTTDTNSDILMVRQRTATNPHEICIGPNSTGGYGVIQGIHVGVGNDDIHLNPLGGVAVGVNGLGLPTADGSGGFTTLPNYEILPNQIITAAGGFSQSITGCIYSKLGCFVSVYIPSTQTASSVSTGTITLTSLPARFSPAVSFYTTAYGQSGATNTVLSAQLNTNGTIVISPASGNSFAGSGNQGFYALNFTFRTAN